MCTVIGKNTFSDPDERTLMERAVTQHWLCPVTQTSWENRAKARDTECIQQLLTQIQRVALVFSLTLDHLYPVFYPTRD